MDVRFQRLLFSKHPLEGNVIHLGLNGFEVVVIVGHLEDEGQDFRAGTKFQIPSNGGTDIDLLGLNESTSKLFNHILSLGIINRVERSKAKVKAPDVGSRPKDSVDDFVKNMLVRRNQDLAVS